MGDISGNKDLGRTIVVPQQTSTATFSGSKINPGLVVPIEGHQHLSRLLNWLDARGRDHQGMLCRLP